MRIAVYASARNEEKNLNDWIACTEEADFRIINDTGSSDGTYDDLLGRDLGAFIVTQLPVEPMTLSNALNIALAQLPEVDLCIRLDLDERLQPGWRETLGRLTIDGPTVFQPWFDHRGCTYRHDRIHTPGFRWELPVHEILSHDGPYQRVPVEVTIEHHQDLTKDRSQVLGELEDAVRADPDNMRMLHYLGREYTYRGDWQSAIPLLRRNAESPEVYAEERSESYLLLGAAYCALLPPDELTGKAFVEACSIAPNRRECFVALADFLHKQGNWRDCLEVSLEALAITEKSWYFNQPDAWGGKADHLAALASWNLDLFDDALRYGRRAVELDPDNDLYAANLAWYSVKEPVNG